LKSSKEIDEDLKDLALPEEVNHYKNIDESNSSLQSRHSFQSNIADFKNNSPINNSNHKSSKEREEDLADLEITENFNFYNVSNSNLQSNTSIGSNITDFKNFSLTPLFQ
ncbi:15367_t:CDS:2, partial [Funneliformis mosseae]